MTQEKKIHIIIQQHKNHTRKKWHNTTTTKPHRSPTPHTHTIRTRTIPFRWRLNTTNRVSSSQAGYYYALMALLSAELASTNSWWVAGFAGEKLHSFKDPGQSRWFNCWYSCRGQVSSGILWWFLHCDVLFMVGLILNLNIFCCFLFCFFSLLFFFLPLFVSFLFHLLSF